MLPKNGGMVPERLLSFMWRSSNRLYSASLTYGPGGKPWTDSTVPSSTGRPPPGGWAAGTHKSSTFRTGTRCLQRSNRRHRLKETPPRESRLRSKSIEKKMTCAVRLTPW
eukprot:744903-Prymnesium_polylepis.1